MTGAFFGDIAEGTTSWGHDDDACCVVRPCDESLELWARLDYILVNSTQLSICWLFVLAVLLCEPHGEVRGKEHMGLIRNNLMNWTLASS